MSNDIRPLIFDPEHYPEDRETKDDCPAEPCSRSGDFATESELVNLGIFGVSRSVSKEAAREMSELTDEHFKSAVDHGIISFQNTSGDSRPLGR